MRNDLNTLSDAQLLNSFIEICLTRENNDYVFDVKDNNRLFHEMKNVVDELKKRPGDARRLLLSLLHHASLQVRLNAAKSAYALAPQEARRALQDIRSMQHEDYAGDAGMFLWAIDEGIYVPT